MLMPDDDAECEGLTLPGLRYGDVKLVLIDDSGVGCVHGERTIRNAKGSK
jgi:hypothetical protein